MCRPRLRALLARQIFVPQLGHRPHPVLHATDRHYDQPAVPGRGRHADSLRQAPARRHSRRLCACAAGRDAGGGSVGRTDHEPQHDRQPDRPPSDGGDQSDGGRRRGPRQRRWRRRLWRQSGLPQKHPGRDQRGRGADALRALWARQGFGGAWLAPGWAWYRDAIRGLCTQYASYRAQSRPHRVCGLGDARRQAWGELELLAEPRLQSRRQSDEYGHRQDRPRRRDLRGLRRRWRLR